MDYEEKIVLRQIQAFEKFIRNNPTYLTPKQNKKLNKLTKKMKKVIHYEYWNEIN